MNYFLLFVFGTLPSFIWLLYFLRKDVHPEPNRMILFVFAAGMASALVALAAEQILFPLFAKVSFPLSGILTLFIGVALVEELAKYGAVSVTALKNKVIDEPIDIPLYFIVAGLGFAALENVLVLLGTGTALGAPEIAGLNVLRFLGAVFLHALVSGLFGYYVVQKRFFWGLVWATSLHGVFNWFILKEQGVFQFLIPAAIILGLVIFMTRILQRLKTQ